MEIDNTLLLKLERLARLKLDTDERSEMIEDLGKMLEMIETLQKVDTEGVEPLIYISKEKNILREDVIEAHTPKKSALANAPAHDSDYFKVPKVITK